MTTTTAAAHNIDNVISTPIPVERLDFFGGIEVIYLKEGSDNMEDRPIVTHALDAYKVFHHYWNHHKIDLLEEFNVLFLDENKRVLHIYAAACGGMAGVIVDTQTILAMAVKLRARGIILAHNHPSGELAPSDLDKKLTRRVNRAADLLNIKMLDHLILSSKACYSICEDTTIPLWRLRESSVRLRAIHNIDRIDVAFKREEVTGKAGVMTLDKKNTRQAHKNLLQFWHPEKIKRVKELKVVFLNGHNRILQVMPLLEDDLTGSYAETARIILDALRIAATRLVLVQNLPEGHMRFAPDDEAWLDQVKAAAESFVIELADYIIITADCYYSCSDTWK